MSATPSGSKVWKTFSLTPRRCCDSNWTKNNAKLIRNRVASVGGDPCGGILLLRWSDISRRDWCSRSVLARDAQHRRHRQGSLALLADLTQRSCKLYSKARRRWLPNWGNSLGWVALRNAGAGSWPRLQERGNLARHAELRPCWGHLTKGEIKYDNGPVAPVVVWRCRKTARFSAFRDSSAIW